MRDSIAQMFVRRAQLWQACGHSSLVSVIAEAATAAIEAINKGNKLIIFGNGGSAAEAQHFAAELVCQFERPRRALSAIALTVDSSILTAQANDFGFASVFARQIQALGRPGDVVFGMTTSDASGDHSANIREALMAAREVGATSILLCSQKTNDLLPLCDLAVPVPDDNTARIQEVHLGIVHMISKLIEEGIV